MESYILEIHSNEDFDLIENEEEREEMQEAYEDEIEAVYQYLEENKIGSKFTNYKLQDWIFSRQRFWGEPIPMVHCEKCGWVPVDEKDLPVVLPNVESYEPTKDGESPLSLLDDFVNTT